MNPNDLIQSLPDAGAQLGLRPELVQDIAFYADQYKRQAAAIEYSRQQMVRVLQAAGYSTIEVMGAWRAVYDRNFKQCELVVIPEGVCRSLPT